MTTSTLTIRPLDPVGAEVTGLAGVECFGSGIARALNEAWWEHGVLLFRGVATDDAHIALSRCFGELEIHPLKELRAPENPLFFPLGGERVSARVYDGTDVLVNRIPWHRDTAFTTSMCTGAMLRMVEVPETLGETLLGDTAAAYDALPAAVKRRIEGLEYRGCKAKATINHIGVAAWWNSVRPARADECPPGMAPAANEKSTTDKSQYAEVEMPVVLTHPESGRKCLFLSPMNVDYFLGMDPAESDDLLAYLVGHMTSARFVYKHRWSVNDAVIWDNRRFIHAAFGNHPTMPRRGLRTTLSARLEVGRYATGIPAPAVTALA